MRVKISEKGFLAKVDMKNSYDIVRWDFLWHPTLEDAGLSSNIINVIMNFVTLIVLLKPFNHLGGWSKETCYFFIFLFFI